MAAIRRLVRLPLQLAAAVEAHMIVKLVALAAQVAVEVKVQA
jgi:hypothetical protein